MVSASFQNVSTRFKVHITGNSLSLPRFICGKHITDFTQMDAEISSAFRTSYCKKTPNLYADV